MKQIALAFLVLAAVACDSPGSKKATGYGTGRDTTRTIVIYTHSPLENMYKIGSAVRFSWDTTLPDPADKTKNIPQRDTFYNVRIFERVLDSLGNVVKRPNGRDSVTDQWLQFNKRGIVHDFNYNFMPVYNDQIEQLKAAAQKR